MLLPDGVPAFRFSAFLRGGQAAMGMQRWQAGDERVQLLASGVARPCGAVQRLPFSFREPLPGMGSPFPCPFMMFCLLPMAGKGPFRVP